MEKFNFKKKYGQNFIQNEDILNRIVESFDLDNEDIILEIGPGAGALTKKLIKFGNDVVAFEIDETLKEYLKGISTSNLKVIFKDFLEVNLRDYFGDSDKINVIANIPYYITTPIITKFIKENFIPKCMVLMVQKEVALRLCAKPKSSDYGAISVILNYFFDLDYLFTVSKEDFYPVPNIDSAIIKLNKKSANINLKSYEKFEKLVFDAFKQKRKNLRNNLKSYDLKKIEEILSKYSLNLTNRAEDLDYIIFVEISNII
ncbi:MAG: ribosomal RNA small subunit methyltransferase A [Bacilli bacterium]|nr:ribosomal RNA small subunit methyltransferase A [Bacilli bacterium]